MEIAIVSLTIIILGLLVERYLFVRETNKQLGEATRAVLSRNINDFITATTVDKIVKDTKPERDEVLLSESSDEDFDKTIKNINK